MQSSWSSPTHWSRFFAQTPPPPFDGTQLRPMNWPLGAYGHEVRSRRLPSSPQAHGHSSQPATRVSWRNARSGEFIRRTLASRDSNRQAGGATRRFRWSRFFGFISGSRASRISGNAPHSSKKDKQPAPRLDNVSRPLPGERPFASPRREQEVAFLASHLPPGQQPEVMRCLRATLRFREEWGQERQEEPGQKKKPPVERRRFGLCGEALSPLPTEEVQRLMREEWEETVRTLETDVSRTLRNWWLAMHCTRLGQLYDELARAARRCDPLEEVRNALALLWA